MKTRLFITRSSRWVVLPGVCSTALFSQAQTKPLPQEGLIIDPVSPAAFVLSRRTDYVVLPDSLQRKGLTGFVAVRVALTPTGAHHLVRVQKVRVTEPGQAMLSIDLEEYQEPTIPYLVRSSPYFPLVVQYVQREDPPSVSWSSDIRGLPRAV